MPDVPFVVVSAKDVLKSSRLRSTPEVVVSTTNAAQSAANAFFSLITVPFPFFRGFRPVFFRGGGAQSFLRAHIPDGAARSLPPPPQIINQL